MRRTRLLIAVLIALLACAAPRVAGSACWAKFTVDEFPQCQQLSGVYSLHWRIDGGVVTFGVSIATVPGWFGIGLSEAGGMKGADMMVVQRDPDTGAWAVQDMYSAAYEAPVPDAQQDATLRNVTTDAAGLAAVLSRAVATCDPSDLPLLTNGLQQHIVWAYGDGPTLAYHGPSQRGDAAVTFVPDPRAAPPADPPDLVSLDAVMPAYAVPTAPTTYACTAVQLPPGPKRHLIRYRSVVGSKLVHHMILYGCAAPPQQAAGTPFPCSGMPPDCQTFYLGWAPGVTGVALPADAGFALGGPGGIEWLALQVHYNNPAGVTVAPDSSGFRIFLTQQLRPHDVGVLMVGQPDLRIPPATANYTATPNLCPAGCTGQFSGNLTLLSVSPHMHMTGRTIITRRIRRGVELAPLVYRRHWDFNYQQMLLPDPDDNVLMPGDELLTACSYDTSERTTMTRMGEGSEDEMCWTFVTYYPANPNVDVCVSATAPAFATCTTRAVLSKLDAKNTTNLMVMLTEGKFVPATLGSYEPYAPTCHRSDASPPSPMAGLSAVSTPLATGAQAGGSPTPSPVPKIRHSSASTRRPAAAAVALWLVTCLAAALGVAAPIGGLSVLGAGSGDQLQHNAGIVLRPMPVAPKEQKHAAAMTSPNMTCSMAASMGGTAIGAMCRAVSGLRCNTRSSALLLETNEGQGW